MRLALALALVSGALLVGAKPSPAPAATAYAYVAYDRDADKAPSVGDELRWFVASSTAVTVRFECWTDSAKTTKRIAYASPSVPGPSEGYGTAFGFDLTTGSIGYCESNAVTSDGRASGLNWLMVGA